MNKLSQFLETPSGRFSSNRLIYIIGSIGILFIWGYKTLISPTGYELPDSTVWIFGILQGGKVWSGYSEKSKATISVPNTTTK